MALTGFTRGDSYTPVPNPMFGPVLEQIQDLAELKVTLRGLWLLHRKRSRSGPKSTAVSPAIAGVVSQAVSIDEFLADRSLLRGLSGPGKDPAVEVRRGLELAVGRGTLLSSSAAITPGRGQDAGRLFFLNDEAGRLALTRLQKHEGATPAATGLLPEHLLGNPAGHPAADKPNIFSLYEDNIGSLAPILAEEMKEAEERYPWEWIREAFRIAAVENKRNWRYVAGILRRWGAEGKDEGKRDGKPGRHSEADQRQKYLEQYKRQRQQHRDRSGPGG